MRKTEKMLKNGHFSYLSVAYHLIYLIFLNLFTAKILDIKECFEIKFKKVITKLLIKFLALSLAEC